MENSNKIAKKLKIWLHFKLLGWNSPRKSKNKYYRSVPTGCIMENSKKISKILKILKKTIMALFQVKIGWKMPRKRENKNYRFVSFLLDA